MKWLALLFFFHPLLPHASAAAEDPRCFEVFLHELGFDAKQRHVELSYAEEGKHVFFNAYNGRIKIEKPEFIAASNSDLVFTIRMNQSEFDTFKGLIAERDRLRQADWCTLGACKVLSQSTGMVLPGPVVFFPRTLVYHMMMLRMLNPSRVTAVRFLGSKTIYFIIRQMSLGGTLEFAALGYGGYKIHQKLSQPDSASTQKQSQKVDQYEVELEDASGKHTKKVIEVDSPEMPTH